MAAEELLDFFVQKPWQKTRKDEFCRDETNSVFLAVPIGTSVWKMLLTARALYQGDWLHMSLLLKKHCGKTIKKRNYIEKQPVIMDFSTWNSYSNKEDLSDFNCTKIHLLTEEIVGVSQVCCSLDFEQLSNHLGCSKTDIPQLISSVDKNGTQKWS